MSKINADFVNCDLGWLVWHYPELELSVICTNRASLSWSDSESEHLEGN